MNECINSLKENEKVREITEEFCINADIAVKEIVNSLKENSETYGELIEKIEILKKSAIWDGKITGKYIKVSLFDKCIEVIKKEMNDLKIIIHP